MDHCIDGAAFGSEIDKVLRLIEKEKILLYICQSLLNG